MSKFDSLQEFCPMVRKTVKYGIPIKQVKIINLTFDKRREYTLLPVLVFFCEFTLNHMILRKFTLFHRISDDTKNRVKFCKFTKCLFSLQNFT
jgi:hypothetical protein